MDFKALSTLSFCPLPSDALFATSSRNQSSSTALSAPQLPELALAFSCPTSPQSLFEPQLPMLCPGLSTSTLLAAPVLVDPSLVFQEPSVPFAQVDQVLFSQVERHVLLPAKLARKAFSAIFSTNSVILAVSLHVSSWRDTSAPSSFERLLRLLRTLRTCSSSTRRSRAPLRLERCRTPPPAVRGSSSASAPSRLRCFIM